MIASLASWLTALSRREQILLGVAGMLALAVLGFYGVYRPLYNAATEARRDLYEASQQAGRIKAKAALIEQASGNRPAPLAAPLNVLIATEAGERGFTLERNEPSGDARTEIAIGSARSSALFAWFADLERRGIIAEGLTARRSDDGTVAVTTRLSKAGS